VKGRLSIGRTSHKIHWFFSQQLFNGAPRVMKQVLAIFREGVSERMPWHALSSFPMSAITDHVPTLQYGEFNRQTN
jgi:hypothetical protein